MKAKLENLSLKGAVNVVPFAMEDDRGTFSKPLDGELARALGFQAKESFFSINRAGALRGLHYMHPNSQSRLVFCMRGRIFDVIVDLRENSPTFGSWQGAMLHGKQSEGIYIPKGFAHGFLSLENGSEVLYYADEEYDLASDLGIRYDDPTLAIKWPIGNLQPTISPRDLAHPLFKDVFGKD